MEKSTGKSQNDQTVSNQIEDPLLKDASWWSVPSLRKLYLLMPIIFLASTVNGYDGSLLNGLQSSTQWESYFDNPNSSRLGLLSATAAIGGVAALAFAPYMADHLGRRLTIAIGVVITFVGIILQLVGHVSFAQFCIGRFVMGLGMCIEGSSAPLLVVELAHPKHRGKLSTLYNTLWYLGAIIAAWTVFGTIKLEGTQAWRIPVGLQLLMPGILGLCIFCLPESPRWLCARDRREEALQVLIKWHANGNENSAFAHQEFHEIQQAIALERQNAHLGWKILVQTPGNRKRLLLVTLVALFSQCSGNSLVSYYISKILNSVGITSSTEQTLINGCLMIWCLIDSVICALLVDKVGRKTLFMTAAVGMLITFSIWTGCSAKYAEDGSKGAARAVIAMIFIFYGASGFAYPGLTPAYTSEIMPFTIRAKGMSYSVAVQNLAGIFNVYVNPIGLSHAGWKFYFLYIAILVIECFCVWFLFVETKGPTLEEIAQLFDGDEATVIDPEKAIEMGEVTTIENKEDQ